MCSLVDAFSRSPEAKQILQDRVNSNLSPSLHPHLRKGLVAPLGVVALRYYRHGGGALDEYDEVQRLQMTRWCGLMG